MRAPILIQLLLAAVLLGCGCASGSRQPTGTRQSPEALKRGVARLSEPLHACYVKHGVGGYVQARLTIETGGRVSAVEIDGKFAGTPTGECVRQVLLTQAQFELEHGPLMVRYPVLLR